MLGRQYLSDRVKFSAVDVQAASGGDQPWETVAVFGGHLFHACAALSSLAPASSRRRHLIPQPHRVTPVIPGAGLRTGSR
jgi:hypothetical protein